MRSYVNTSPGGQPGLVFMYTHHTFHRTRFRYGRSGLSAPPCSDRCSRRSERVMLPQEFVVERR